ncbi:hypothetical protein KIN20_033500 [Parelaphostrongylus tenuis]|uniref:Uncharacterized protein n=1 Tax=Parelaphostrongylus tenuis TaxID=148309 RepID=A0AAD5RAD9_PARTN|nr:hypothetical protein KIN20_033500 [Parelaphostrongylus tenuis]
MDLIRAHSSTDAQAQEHRSKAAPSSSARSFLTNVITESNRPKACNRAARNYIGGD